jgi:SAM-dependent methyltransferase
MSIAAYAIAALVALGSFGFLLLLFAMMIDSLVRGHDIPTSRRATRSIEKIISEHAAGKNFYDLGCAYGALAVRIKRKFPDLAVCAVDDDPLRIFVGRIRAFIFRCNVTFLRKNIFELDVRDADVVYTYLWYDHMPPLEKKLQKELKQGAIVITNTSHFPTWRPMKKVVTYPGVSGTQDFETLFVYQKI